MVQRVSGRASALPTAIRDLFTLIVQIPTRVRRARLRTKVSDAWVSELGQLFVAATLIIAPFRRSAVPIIGPASRQVDSGGSVPELLLEAQTGTTPRADDR